jgi:hypothetical protein
MKRYLYSDTIERFLITETDIVWGKLTSEDHHHQNILTQRAAWKQEIIMLKESLKGYKGQIYFEYDIPRMGRCIDVVLIIKNVIFVLEFKVGSSEFILNDVDQVWDYALDLKNFHEKSHKNILAPILIATHAKELSLNIESTPHNDNLLFPIKTNIELLSSVINNILAFAEGDGEDIVDWANGRYMPTPTIIEAALALYNNHSVADISRSDASARNLTHTRKAVSEIIDKAKAESIKTICFVTGVPGAGKTLVGLDIASKNQDKDNEMSSVFLSGNGPLVDILREALTRDKVKREVEAGRKMTKGAASTIVKKFIQNVHHLRDDCLRDKNPPFEHVTIFDEAQRAWDQKQTIDFMRRKRDQADFDSSEPEFLISCLNRHKDWAAIICLVGGGQEINTGEAGINEWIESLIRKYQDWHVYVSSHLTDSEYAAGNALQLLQNKDNVFFKDDLHLSVSQRSFRAENLSHLIKNILDQNIPEAQKQYQKLKKKYPLVLTRDFKTAKQWLKSNARGSERYGIVASSQAQRLKPHAINVKAPMDYIHWFLDGKDDVRSSYYLEDVATEFHIQGLELDWSCLTWDADFRYSKDEWKTFSFVGSKWHNIHKLENKQYLKNAYRVLLTRARQGMVIVVPDGDAEDHTRKSEYFDTTYNYLKEIGLEII